MKTPRCLLYLFICLLLSRMSSPSVKTEAHQRAWDMASTTFHTIPTTPQWVRVQLKTGLFQSDLMKPDLLASFCDSGLTSSQLYEIYSPLVENIGCPYCFLKFHIRVPFKAHDSFTQFFRRLGSYKQLHSYQSCFLDDGKEAKEKRLVTFEGVTEEHLLCYLRGHILYAHKTCTVPLRRGMLPLLYPEKEKQPSPLPFPLVEDGGKIVVPAIDPSMSHHPSTAIIVTWEPPEEKKETTTPTWEDDIKSQLLVYYTPTGTIDIWDLPVYLPYLEARLTNLESMEKSVRTRPDFESTIRGTNPWNWFREEGRDVECEIMRAKNYLNYPSQWCPTNPSTLFWQPMNIKQTPIVIPSEF